MSRLPPSSEYLTDTLVPEMAPVPMPDPVIVVVPPPRFFTSSFPLEASKDTLNIGSQSPAPLLASAAHRNDARPQGRYAAFGAAGQIEDLA